jgi:NADH oxidase (H2O-forming)
MRDVIEIKPNIFWIGAEDPQLRVFDDLFPTEHGTTYNSYLIKGNGKIAIIDTVKAKYAEDYLDKIRQLTDLAAVDYIIVNHTEPDHSGSLAQLLEQCPKAKVYASQAAMTFLGNMIHTPFPSHVVKDGETLDLGGKQLSFIIAPFLHWPDTMFTYLDQDEMLFTCDAFGAHYCGASLFNDENPDLSGEMKFYFDCLVRPFKDKALSAIAKAGKLQIDMICPSHGPIHRTDPLKAVQLYQEWSTQKSNGKMVVILYISPHGNTRKMAMAVAKGASVAGVEVINCHFPESSRDEIRDLMEQADAIIFGVPTVNRDVPRPMWEVLADLSTVKLKASIGGVFGSYGWSGEACKMVEERLKGLNFQLPTPFVRAQFVPRPEALELCKALGQNIAEEVLMK